MTRQGFKFIYANEYSDSYGVIVAHIQNINTDTNDEESEIIQSTTPYKDTWDFHGLVKSSPLQFKMTVIKQNGDFIDAKDQEMLKKWLCKPRRYWLQIEQDDLSDVYYNCIMINPRPVSVGTYTGGLEVTILCDSTHAWSGINSKPYTSTGNLAFSKNLEISFDEYVVYPILEIVPSTNGTISVANATTNETLTITDCIANEVIKMDCTSDKISSTNSGIINRWNKNTFGLIQGINNITITGSCKLTMSYRLPVRVGG